MRFSPSITHILGKNQISEDALSRVPHSGPEKADINLVKEVELLTKQATDSLPALKNKLHEIKELQKSDPETAKIREYCTNGWPTYMPESPLIKQYWTDREHLTIVDDLLLFDSRIVIPRQMRIEMLEHIHEGHLGIVKCQALASFSIWWPHISKDIEDLVQNRDTCAKHRPTQKEPLLPSSFPERQWARLGMDLFELHGKTFLVVADYYSRWPELRRLNNQTSSNLIGKLKCILAVHCIPHVVISDNGPQFASTEFRNFTADSGFTHTTSYPESNGEAERAVQTVKNLLKKSKDPYNALLLYRARPLHNRKSPSELLIGRKLKTKIPTVPFNLLPKTTDHSLIRLKEEGMKQKRRILFNRHHATREATPLKPGDTVFVKDLKKSGEVNKKHHPPFLHCTDGQWPYQMQSHTPGCNLQ